jgi:hypothetical protein
MAATGPAEAKVDEKAAANPTEPKRAPKSAGK